MHVSDRNRPILTLICAVLLVAGCSGTATETDGTGMAIGDHEHSDTVEVDPGTAPSVELKVTKDMVGGWNLHADVAGMSLAPDKAGLPDVEGEGHMHLYIDGVKHSRVYTPWYHIAELEPGTHQVSVTLNTNSHATLALDGQPISSMVPIDQPETSTAMHAHAAMTHAASTPMTVAMKVTPDPRSGWNVFIETTGFAWAPQHASTEHVDGEGHAHLYVDGAKIARLYGDAYHFQFDQPGIHEVKVGLNGNDHMPYIVNGTLVEATAEIEIEGEAIEADRSVDVTVSGSEVSGPGRVELTAGESVQITVNSDTADTLHIHGYDVYGETGPGNPAVLTITADIPGIFEVELEESGVRVLELVVR